MAAGGGLLEEGATGERHGFYAREPKGWTPEPARAGSGRPLLFVEEEVRNVAVAHDVGFAFRAHFAGGLDGGFGVIFQQAF